VSTAAYDSKNEENFETVTLALDAALKKMERDSAISANASQLAKLAGVHRNTIYHRKWPLERLKEIKAKRAQQKEDQAVTKAKSRSPEEMLEQSRIEIIYWFTQLQDARSANADLMTNVRMTAKARDHYMDEHQQCLGIINQLRSDIRKLENTILVLQDEIHQLQGGSNA